MTNNDDSSIRFLISTALHELASQAEAVLDLAKALEDQATGTASVAAPQRLREMAALVRSAALALLGAAANVVGGTQQLTLLAALAEVDNSGGENLPS